MKVRLEQTIECGMQSVAVTIESEIVDEGDTQIDLVLYQAMVRAVRALGDSVRRDQLGMLNEMAER